MAELFFPTLPVGQPLTIDAAAAGLAIDRIVARAGELDDAATAAWLREVSAEGAAGGILRGIFSNSPFLTGCATADPAFLKELLLLGPDTLLGRVVNELKDRVGRETDRARLMQALRVARRRVAFLVAVADLVGFWPMERVTQTLSDFADVALSAAVSHLLAAAASAGEIALRDDHLPERDCGYVVLAMGKHGARELNYSSDLDLIVLYDPAVVDYRGKRTLQQLFIRMTQTLTSILQEYTADGYAFRVDLRLRPDPGSTPVAIALPAALTYYATRGANWERAAMIKARPAAGDIAFGRRFLEALRPFVWRDHLDFATIDEIHALKRQINAQRGGGRIGFLGHNVKLGRGGIREIEFFAQTQQLIHGGRDPYLRCQRTVDALTTLSEAGCIAESVTDELTEAYDFLRNLEHRLQMVDDQQTQTLPADEAGMRRIAAFMGFAELDAFRETLLFHLRQVETHYAQVFEDAGDAPDLAALLAGKDPAALASGLGRLGYRDAQGAGASLDRLRQRCVAADRVEGGRLVASLLRAAAAAAARTGDPDGALAGVEQFLAGLRRPRRTISLLAANPPLVDLLVAIVLAAPALAQSLAERPERLEPAVAAGFFGVMPHAALLRADCAERLRGAADEQDVLERAAAWAADQRFLVAANTVRLSIDAEAAGRVLADAAVAVAHTLLRRLARETGADEGGPVVLAVGRIGRGDPTLASPLELVFLHSGDGAEAPSSLRLARRLTAALCARTNAGTAWAVDLSDDLWGQPGPLVSSVPAFAGHMTAAPSAMQVVALAWARVIAGPPDLVRQVEAVRRQVLAHPQAMSTLAAHAHSIRKSRGAAATPRDGLDDLVLLATVLRLRHLGDARLDGARSVPAALAMLGEIGVLDAAEAKALGEACRLLRQSENLLAVALPGPPMPGATPKAVGDLLLRATGVPSLGQLETMLADAPATVARALDRHL